MRKAFASFAIATSAVVFVLGTAAPAVAQDKPAASPTPPIEIVSSPPTNLQLSDAEVEAAYDEATLEGFALCHEASRAHLEFAADHHIGNGWSLLSSGTETNSVGSPYESLVLQHVPYLRSLQVDIRTYPEYTECAVLALVGGFDDASRLQRLVEGTIVAQTIADGELEPDVLAAENASWGDIVDVRRYRLLVNDEFTYGLRQMVVGGDVAIHFELTPSAHAQINLIDGSGTK